MNNKKKKLYVSVMFPTMLSTVVIGGLIYVVLQLASLPTAATPDLEEAVPAAFERVEATIETIAVPEYP